jgi:hypothetical protein
MGGSLCLLLLNHFVKKIPNMNAYYNRARGQSRRQDEGSPTTVEHHFRVNIFTTAIDFQLQ